MTNKLSFHTLVVFETLLLGTKIMKMFETFYGYLL